ncbi:unnamed protein product [Dicrocoelium dendriticum]|nr:unnamed protein product [Dicrocoelium dendriticum]
MLSASAELDKSKKIPRMYNSVPSFSQHHRPPLPMKFPISQSSGSCSKSSDIERNLFPHNRKSCEDQFSGFSGYTKLGSGSSSEPGVWETAGWIPGASSNSKSYTISSERLTHSKSEKARRRLLTTQKDSSMKEKSKTKILARSSDNLTYSGSPQWRKPSRERVVSPSKRTSQAHQSKSTVASKRALVSCIYFSPAPNMKTVNTFVPGSDSS